MIELINLPTGKPHISFSEHTDWVKCSWRHKLKHVKKINLDKPSPVMSFGTAVHASCEDFVKTRKMNVDIAHAKIDELWEMNKAVLGFDISKIDEWKDEASAILADVPTFMDENFPEWQPLASEFQLYESITGGQHAFKGFIDAVISAPKKSKQLIWLIDWKTTVFWSSEKKRDPVLQRQLVFYKHFWQQKHPDVLLKNIRCAFVLLKRNCKPGKHCEIVTVSVGDTSIAKSLKVIDNMIASVTRGTAIKNRSSCKYCEFKDTEHCT